MTKKFEEQWGMTEAEFEETWGLTPAEAAVFKSTTHVDKGGTTWITDAYGTWPIINGSPYYGMMVHEPDGSCYPLRDQDYCD